MTDDLRRGEPVDVDRAQDLMHHNDSHGGVVPQQGTASEDVFFDRSQSRPDRTVISADIRDLGLDLFNGNAAAMRAVARGETDADAASRTANDEVVQFLRDSVAALRRTYADVLPQARALADGDPELLRALADPIESEPLVLLGGDEITISLHRALEPFANVFARTLVEHANSRVAVTRTGEPPEATESDPRPAMQEAESAQDALKDHELLLRELRLMVARLSADGVPNDQRLEAQAMVDELGLQHLYTAQVDGETVLRRHDTGEVFDVDSFIVRVEWCMEVIASMRPRSGIGYDD
jgi:hypothetical protein